VAEEKRKVRFGDLVMSRKRLLNHTAISSGSVTDRQERAAIKHITRKWQSIQLRLKEKFLELRTISETTRSKTWQPTPELNSLKGLAFLKRRRLDGRQLRADFEANAPNISTALKTVCSYSFNP
jgi:hypothetical protein